jgi:hypothetical protein
MFSEFVIFLEKQASSAISGGLLLFLIVIAFFIMIDLSKEVI